MAVEDELFHVLLSPRKKQNSFQEKRTLYQQSSFIWNVDE